MIPVARFWKATTNKLPTPWAKTGIKDTNWTGTAFSDLVTSSDPICIVNYVNDGGIGE